MKSPALVLLFVCFCALGTLTVWGVVRHLYIRPLRRLFEQIKAVRYEGRDYLIVSDQPGLIGRIAHEFRLLHIAHAQTQNALERSGRITDGRIKNRTQKLETLICRLQKTARTDGLTGLANRACLDLHLRRMFYQAEKDGSDLACMMIDIDNFKRFNDRMGHITGDDLIAFVGSLLKGCIRTGGVAGRYGGDEFVVLLPVCSLAQARTVAERIRALFARESARFAPEGGPSGNRTDESPGLSIGLAALRYHQPGTPRQLLALADQALYQAKNTGRNSVACF